MRGAAETACTSRERSIGSTSNVAPRTATFAGDLPKGLPNSASVTCDPFTVAYHTQHRPARMDAARWGTTPRVHITLSLLEAV